MHGAALSVACLLCIPPTVVAAHSHRESELAYFHAQQILRRLEAKPVSERTRMDYERALNAYRAVYHGDPGSPDAARSIASTAYLLASAGRRFHQKKLSHDAVRQWEFLRRQYPTSPLRKRALFEQAQIEEFDLHDLDAAKKIYRSFLTDYPNGPLAVDARAGLEGHPVQEEAEEQPDELQKANEQAAMGMPDSVPKAAPANTRADTVRQSATSRASQAASLPMATDSAKSLPTATIQHVRYWASGNSTRLAVDMSNPVPYRTYPSEDGRQVTVLFFGAHAGAPRLNSAIAAVQDANLSSMHINSLGGNQTALVLKLKRPVDVGSFVLSHPSRVILDLKPEPAAEIARKRRLATSRGMPATRAQAKPETKRLHPGVKAVAVAKKSDGAASSTDLISSIAPAVPTVPAQTSPYMSQAPVPPAEPVASGQRSMTRVLGLRVRRIVIDAGHGGHDSGTIGPDGLEEKDVTLAVALRLGHLLRQRLGADVIYTRQTDKYVPLEERTAIANKAHADLFLSIHANSSSDPQVRGIETYFLNFTSSPDAMAVAARENADSDRSVHELSGLLRKIALSDKIDESREFADDVQQQLYEGMAPGNPGLKDRGVKQAPFVVLIGARMPSILTEISFLTNSESDRELRQPAYRERLAEALYRGVAEYVQGMSGVRVAKTMAAEVAPDPAE